MKAKGDTILNTFNPIKYTSNVIDMGFRAQKYAEQHINNNI